MSRYTFKLDTLYRTYEIKDTETGSILNINQELSDGYFSRQDDSATDSLVEFANDFQDDIANGIFALDLGSSLNILSFKDDNFPRLSGGISLRNCAIHNPNLTNVDLRDVRILKAEMTTITQSTIDGMRWESQTPVTISHCFVNEKYNTVLDRLSNDRNEWFMNQRVDKEMW